MPLKAHMLVGCRQLGPVLHSAPAEAHGLKISLLEAFVQYHSTQHQHFADLGLAPCLGMLLPCSVCLLLSSNALSNAVSG